jgi:hypothetical protein
MALNGAPPTLSLTRATRGFSHSGTASKGLNSGKPPKKPVQHGVSHSLPNRALFYLTRNHRMF